MHHLTSIRKIFIVNFDDSFTYNIASIIYPHFKEIEVIDYKDFFLKNSPNFNNENICGIILGPGPGHPADYFDYFTEIRRLINKKNIFILGICLGHQILAMIDGFKIVSAKELKHGESELINYKNKNFNVQRYNSLVPLSDNVRGSNLLELLVVNSEVLILKGDNCLSFQFHPESIGTDDNIFFFTEILDHVTK